MNDNTEALPPLPLHFTQLIDGTLVYTAEQLREAQRAALAHRQQVPTTAWLVEWRFNGVQWLYLWPSAPGGFSFTSDASKALRFARREDAEAALQWARDTDAARRPIGSLTRHGLALGEMLVTEHDWPALPAAPSAQSKPLQSIPDSALVAARKTLEGKSGVDFLDGWVEFVAILGAAPLAAQAEPQVPLTDDEIVKATAHCGVSKYTAISIVRAAERAAMARAHGIGKQEGK